MNEKKIVKFDMFYRHNFVCENANEKTIDNNSISYKNMRKILIDQKYFEKKTNVIKYTNDENHVMKINNFMIFQNLFFMLKNELSSMIKLHVIEKNHKRLINLSFNRFLHFIFECWSISDKIFSNFKSKTFKQTSQNFIYQRKFRNCENHKKNEFISFKIESSFDNSQNYCQKKKRFFQKHTFFIEYRCCQKTRNFDFHIFERKRRW